MKLPVLADLAISVSLRSSAPNVSRIRVARRTTGAIRGRPGAESVLCGRRGEPNKASRNFELAVFGAQSLKL